MRVIGLDVHRSFAVSAVLEDGRMSAGGWSASRPCRPARPSASSRFTKSTTL